MKEWTSADADDLCRIKDDPSAASPADIRRLVDIVEAAAWGVRMARHFSPTAPNPGFPGRSWEALCCGLDGEAVPEDDYDRMIRESTQPTPPPTE